MPTPNNAASATAGHAVLELAARNPMDAVRHVAACLARRAYPLLGLACLPDPVAGTARLVVAVADDGRLPRLVTELAGLPEVLAARIGDPRAPVLAMLAGEAALA